MPSGPLSRNYLISRAHISNTLVSAVRRAMASDLLYLYYALVPSPTPVSPSAPYYEQIQPTIGAPAEFSHFRACDRAPLIVLLRIEGFS